MSTTIPTQAQISAVGFTALTIGKVFAQLEDAKANLSYEQLQGLTHPVGVWLREEYGDEVVEAAKEVLGAEPIDHEASEEEVDAAVNAVKTSLALLLDKLHETNSSIGLNHAQLTEELKLALAEAYDTEEVEKRWPTSSDEKTI